MSSCKWESSPSGLSRNPMFCRGFQRHTALSGSGFKSTCIHKEDELKAVSLVGVRIYTWGGESLRVVTSQEFMSHTDESCG